MWHSTSTADQPIDSIVESVINKYKQRSNIGIKKYGVTMDRDDLTDVEWLTHAQEEALDLSLYLEKMIVREKAQKVDGLVLVYKFMEALNINMDSIFQITDVYGNPVEIKVSDVFNNL